jgi:hypothetical protein
MKTIFKGIGMSYSGKNDGLVYYYNHYLRRTIARKLVVGKPTPQQARIKEVSQNLASLHLSEGYIRDLKFYVSEYNKRSHKHNLCVYNWNNLFTKIMWTMAKELNLDLATLTREQILNGNLPCRTVKQAIEAGLIPTMNYFETLINEL